MCHFGCPKHLQFLRHFCQAGKYKLGGRPELWLMGQQLEARQDNLKYVQWQQMLSSLNLSPTPVWFILAREKRLHYFKQGELRNLYILVLVLFDFVLHFQKVVEIWYAARIRSSLENSFIQRAVNRSSSSFPDFLPPTGDLCNHPSSPYYFTSKL